MGFVTAFSQSRTGEPWTKYFGTSLSHVWVGLTAPTAALPRGNGRAPSVPTSVPDLEVLGTLRQSRGAQKRHTPTEDIFAAETAEERGGEDGRRCWRAAVHESTRPVTQTGTYMPPSPHQPRRGEVAAGSQAREPQGKVRRDLEGAHAIHQTLDIKAARRMCGKWEVTESGNRSVDRSTPPSSQQLYSPRPRGANSSRARGRSNG